MIRTLNRAGLFIAGMAVLAMCLIGSIDVIASHIVGAPLPAAYEVTELLLAIAIFLAISSLQERRMNIFIETIYERTSSGFQKMVTRLSNILGLVFFGLIAWQCWLLAAGYRERRDTRIYAGHLRHPHLPDEDYLRLRRLPDCRAVHEGHHHVIHGCGTGAAPRPHALMASVEFGSAIANCSTRQKQTVFVGPLHPMQEFSNPPSADARHAPRR